MFHTGQLPDSDLFDLTNWNHGFQKNLNISLKEIANTINPHHSFPLSKIRYLL